MDIVPLGVAALLDVAPLLHELSLRKLTPIPLL